MCALRLSLLGGFQAEWDGAPVSGFESDKARALLAYLAVESDRPHRRDVLTGLLWPEWTESRARHNLSQALFSLRTLFPARADAPLFEVSSQDIRVCPEACWVDSREFEALLQMAEAHDHEGDQLCSACIEHMERAVALYKGPFLDGLNLRDSAAFDEWVVPLREAFQEKAGQTLGTLARSFVALGDPERALDYARRWAELSPLEDAAHRQVMAVLGQLGRRLEALAHYTSYQKLLQGELGLGPEADTTALYQRMLEASAGPAGWEGTAPRRPSLPSPTLPLLGRQRERDELRRCLAGEGCRLLTLLGGGGSGKTHLALEVGRALLPQFPDGVVLVELTDGQVHEPLVFQIARAVGMELPTVAGGSGLEPRRTVEGMLFSFLQHRHVLLILDGFEVALDESRTVGELLGRAAGLKILATSRVRLNLRAEHVLMLDGLPYPEGTAEVDEPAGYAAVQLFVEAARRSRPDFALDEGKLQSVVDICRMVQGMPLGIWLAAAWADILEPAQIADAIRRDQGFLATEGMDLPERQRSLKGTFEYSLRLLAKAERAAFLRLSAFRGVFSAERARQVGEVELRTLRGLVDHSLLQPLGEGTFRIHDLLRQYAREQLAARPEEERAVRTRHCAVFLEELAAQEPRLKGPEAFEALREIDRQYADIAVAWEWGVERGAFDLLGEGAWALGRYLVVRERHAEGIALCEKALERLGCALRTPETLRLALQLADTLANCLIRENALARCRQVLDRAEALLHDHPDLSAGVRREAAFLLMTRGRLCTASGGSHLETVRLHEQALNLLYGLEEPWEIGYGLSGITLAHVNAGNLREGLRYAELGLDGQYPSGDPTLIAELLQQRISALMLSGQSEAALQSVAGLGAYYRHYDDHYHRVIAAIEHGVALFHSGRYEEARPGLEQAVVLFDQPDEREQRFTALWLLDLALLALGDYAAVHLGPDLQGEERAALDQTDTRFSVPFTWAILDMLEQNWASAERNLLSYAGHVEEVARLDMLGGPLGLLALIAFRRGDMRLAEERMLNALENVVAQGHFLGTLITLGVLALILGESGEPERAVELYGTATSHPVSGASCWFRDVLGAPLTRLAEGLPEEVKQAAEARGKAKTSESAAREALAWLRERGSDAGRLVFTNMSN